jgi:hypothetical protein
VTTAFDFAVLTFRGPDPANPVTDEAPDAAPLYTYTLETPPPPPPVVTVTIKGTSVAVSGTPTAGRKFVVGPYTAHLSDGTLIKLTGLKCTATLGQVRLRGTGTGGCTFALPKTAKGKKLVVKASAKASSVTVSKTLTLRVR